MTELPELVLDGDPPLKIKLRRSSRARRISLRVSSLDGRVTMSLPNGAPESEAVAFARQKASWIRKHLAKGLPVAIPKIGDQIPFEGQPLTLSEHGEKSVRQEADRLLIPSKASNPAPRVAAFLKVAARERLVAACDRYADALGQSYGRITLRDTRSRWGSCSTRKDLMFSWRLIMAPAKVLQYVAAHEVAHLVEMNHSPAYWAALAGIFPDYAGPKHWLRENGQQLHRYRFTN